MASFRDYWSTLLQMSIVLLSVLLNSFPIVHQPESQGVDWPYNLANEMKSHCPHTKCTHWS